MASDEFGRDVLQRLEAGECLRIPRIGRPDYLWAGHDGDQLLLRLGSNAPMLHGRYAEKEIEHVLEARGAGVVEWISRPRAELPGVDERSQSGQQTLVADGGQDGQAPDRVQFTCMDCGGEVDREPNAIDIDGLAPERCALCTLSRMAEGSA